MAAGGTPYLWLPNVEGTAVHEASPGSGGAPQVEVGPSSYLENLKMVLMLAGEARNGAWAVYSDLIYLRFNDEKGRVRAIDFVGIGSNPVAGSADLGSDTTLKGWAWTIGASRSLVSTPQGNFDLLAGLRYFDVEASSDWRLNATFNGPGGAVFAAAGSVTTSTRCGTASLACAAAPASATAPGRCRTTSTSAPARRS
jgi:hypothetical protein